MQDGMVGEEEILEIKCPLSVYDTKNLEEAVNTGKLYEQEETRKKYGENFTIKEYLDEIPNPLEKFMGDKRVTGTSEPHALAFMKSRYRHVNENDIRNIFLKNNRNLSGACEELDDVYYSLSITTLFRATETQFGLGKHSFPCLSVCEAKFNIDTLQKVLNKKLFEGIEKRKQMAEVQSANLEGFVSCPFCEYGAILPKEDNLLKCLNPYCRKISCSCGGILDQNILHEYETKSAAKKAKIEAEYLYPDASNRADSSGLIAFFQSPASPFLKNVGALEFLRKHRCGGGAQLGPLDTSLGTLLKFVGPGDFAHGHWGGAGSVYRGMMLRPGALFGAGNVVSVAGSTGVDICAMGPNKTGYVPESVHNTISIAGIPRTLSQNMNPDLIN
uniref:(California timema) hypothetical protein n=1 Tax=Timema californicum TaxID=61474 RepID=A0A7R9J453_TIMCA|nr:unnamed protein product [Timema californicum]